MDNSKPYTDSRGTITDLFVSPGYSITHITFKKGAIRGNHYHRKTYQYDRIIKGKLIVATKGGELVLKAGDVINFPPSKPHAYQAITDSEIISICVGVRVGSNYEKDVIRLKKPLL